MPRKKNDSPWLPFYFALAQFYEEYLLDENQQIYSAIYESKTLYHTPPWIDKNYRAVLLVDVDALREPLEHVATAFYAAHKAVHQREKDYDPNKIPRLPMYVPRINDDESIFKMQVHENKAHSSKNHRKDEMIPVISVTKGDLTRVIKSDSDEKITYQAALDIAIKALKDEGYVVNVQDDIASTYVTVDIDVNKLCELHECDSIQRRFFTGRQIRANFFSRIDGKLQRSTLKSIGVLLTNQHIEVAHSHERTTRTDAIYTAKHPDEIVLEVIPPLLRSGRLYKKYKVE